MPFAVHHASCALKTSALYARPWEMPSFRNLWRPSRRVTSRKNRLLSTAAMKYHSRESVCEIPQSRARNTA